jgi:hypothetical protein
MTEKQYFGEKITAKEIQTVKQINKEIKSKNVEYSFTKPPAEISIQWNIYDWMNWIDWCHEPGKNHYYDPDGVIVEYGNERVKTVFNTLNSKVVDQLKNKFDLTKEKP